MSPIVKVIKFYCMNSHVNLELKSVSETCSVTFIRKWTDRWTVFIAYIQGVSGGNVNILGSHSIGHSKQKMFIWTCVLFRTVSEVELFECTNSKLLIRKRYYVYVLFLIPVFIVQVTALVQFIINVRKFHRQHYCTSQLVWRNGVLFVWVRLDVPLCRR